jgi:hypothetical protein
MFNFLLNRVAHQPLIVKMSSTHYIRRHTSSSSLATQASYFRIIDRRSLNIEILDEKNSEAVVGDGEAEYSPHLLVGNISKADLLSLRENPKILHGLSDDDERTLAIHLHEVLINYPLRIGRPKSQKKRIFSQLLIHCLEI